MSKQLNYQFLPNSSTKDANILVLPVPYEKTVCAKTGTSTAPQAILSASEQLEYFEEDCLWSPMKYLKISVQNPLQMLKTETELEFHSRLTRSVADLAIDNKQLFIALGGEHSITPSITAARMPNPGTVLFLDAHADLREQYQNSKFSHACPAFRLREQNHKLILVGIRSLHESEYQRIKDDDAHIDLYFDRDLCRQAEQDALLQQISSLSGPVWLSIDMDALNPALVPGVGTPQPGGLSWYFILNILDKLFFNPNIHIAGMDIVELIPEDSQVSQISAAKLLQKSISYWGKAKAFDEKAMTGSQTLVDSE